MRHTFWITALLLFLSSVSIDARSSNEAVPTDLGDTNPVTTFDSFWKVFHENYALFEVKGVDWPLVRRIYRPKVNAATTREELFAIFEEMLELLNDLHVTVSDEQGKRFARSGGRSIGVGDFDTGEFSLELIAQKYIKGRLIQRAGRTLRFGPMTEGIGYIHFEKFRYPTTTTAAMDEVVRTAHTSKGLILDLRQNSGGADQVGRLIAERFVSARLPYISVTNRRGVEFSEKHMLYMEPKNKTTFTGPMVILVNSRTLSAAENFVMAVRELPHVTVVGETTGGAMADTVTVHIEDGWRFTIPVNRIEDGHGRSWEGIGLVPNWWIRNDPEDIEAGHDRVLEFALELLRVMGQ